MSFLSKLLGKSTGPMKVTQANVRTAIANGEDPDQAIIKQLRNAGLDLSSPFHIHHIFSMPSSDAANQIGEQLKSRGLSPETSEESGHWKVAAVEDMILEECSMKAMREEYSKLAGNFGGKYAGWELKTTQKRTTTMRIGE
ncbi:MAG: hypothetical protein DMG21_12695 [Acidobacteria bacterium]|nr:MAG: hypothetical protein DMG21_12695 [Acidobacteriota bacterium]